MTTTTTASSPLANHYYQAASAGARDEQHHSSDCPYSSRSNDSIGSQHHHHDRISSLIEEEQDVEAITTTVSTMKNATGRDDDGIQEQAKVVVVDDRLHQEQQARRRPRRRIKGGDGSNNSRSRSSRSSNATRSKNSSYYICISSIRSAWNNMSTACSWYKKNCTASTSRTTMPRQRQQQQHQPQQKRQPQQRHPKKNNSKAPSATQRAGLFMLFAVLLSMWHYMRTVWWTHGRLAARHVRFLNLQQQQQQQQQRNQEQLNDGQNQQQHHVYPRGRKSRSAANTAAPVHLEDESFQKQEADNHEAAQINRSPLLPRPVQKSRKQQQQQQQQQQQRQPDQLEQQEPGVSNDESSHVVDKENAFRAEQQQRQRERMEQQQQRQRQHQEDDEEDQHEEEVKNLSKLSPHSLQALFAQQQQPQQGSSAATASTLAAGAGRNSNDSNSSISIPDILVAWLDKVDGDIVNNVHGGIRWVLPTLLPPLPAAATATGPSSSKAKAGEEAKTGEHVVKQNKNNKNQYRIFRNVIREKTKTHFAWQEEWSERVKGSAQNRQVVSTTTHTAVMARYLVAHQPVVDYTSAQKYRYPQPLPLEEQSPTVEHYPQLTSLGGIMKHWDQDEDNDGIITETLMHFNYSDPNELEMARRYRNVELPFKLTNVPELVAANLKWTDEYLSQQFDDMLQNVRDDEGHAQESPNHYFAYYNPKKWHVETMGLPPVRINDWAFATWAEHAKYADAVQLRPDQPHFYWQAGTGGGREERSPFNKSNTAAAATVPASNQSSFIARDLPSFSSTTENVILFEPKLQKGIQCRFGERGVVAATHYDAGRNMVGMITGAKRYILSPPKACNNLGIVTSRASPIFRHSLLNFGHLKYLPDHKSENKNDDKEEGQDQMSQQERAWLERASQAQAVETVLKAGEVLYIPSFWFHYIISLQKSAQCNVRSGIGHDESSHFGSEADVLEGIC